MASKKFAYSYDREDYTGSFDTPEEAVAAAVKNAEGVSSPPTEIYVGTIVDADPQASDHAERIIDSMRQRAHVDYGESAARYLKNVTPEQVRELDRLVAQTILGWLEEHKLMPTFVQVRNIREYPWPIPGQKPQPKAEAMEVGEIGVSDNPGYAG